MFQLSVKTVIRHSPPRAVLSKLQPRCRRPLGCWNREPASGPQGPGPGITAPQGRAHNPGWEEGRRTTGGEGWNPEVWRSVQPAD